MGVAAEPNFTASWDAAGIAWVLTSTALVFMMTLGLAFFYGSLCRDKHIIDTLAKTCTVMGVVSVQWVLFGYSFAFGTNNAFWGSFEYGGLNNVHPQDMAFVAFQLSFAVITAALITGAVVGRMKFHSFLVFIFLWTTLVYDPIAHWVWGPEGWLLNLGTLLGGTGGSLDFAGGSVVHINSGVSALAASLILGKRHKDERGEGVVKLTLNLLGATMLWIGWFGFNGGSALAANAVASVALINTQISAATAMLTWALIDLCIKRKIELEGALYGAVCGLVVITPAAGYVIPGWTVLIGMIGASASYLVLWLWMRYAHLRVVDDSLYVFCSHGVGGMIGAIVTGLWATTEVNEAGANGAFYGRWVQLGYQIIDILAVTAYSFVMTCALMLVLKYTIGVREQYNPNMDPEEFSKLGVRIGGPGALEGSLVLPPGMFAQQPLMATDTKSTKGSPRSVGMTSLPEETAVNVDQPQNESTSL